MTDYGNYTTYHFDDVDEMSDYESTGGPPPPPPPEEYKARTIGAPNVDLEKNNNNANKNGNGADQLNTTALTHDAEDDLEDGDYEGYEADDIEEDGSVEIPPTKVVEDMMRREQEAQTNKRGSKVIFMSVVLCILISLAVVLGAGFGTGTFDTSSASAAQEGDIPVGGDTTNTPPGSAQGDERPNTVTDTVGSTTRGQAMREFLADISMVESDDVFADLSSPESLALQWLVLEDPLQLDADNEADQFQITQRYALVALWYNSDFTWANETGWLTGDECEWHGISCFALANNVAASKQGENATSSTTSSENLKNVVVELNLEGNNVQGFIPQDLALLEFLTTLNLADNVMEGSIPTTLTKMISLQELLLDRNLFSQDLSSYDFSPLASLQLLDLSYNTFSGTLPTSLWSMVNLNMLVLDSNAFSGSLSADIAKLTNLGTFYIPLLVIAVVVAAS